MPRFTEEKRERLNVLDKQRYAFKTDDTFSPYVANKLWEHHIELQAIVQDAIADLDEAKELLRGTIPRGYLQMTEELQGKIEAFLAEEKEEEKPELYSGEIVCPICKEQHILLETESPRGKIVCNKCATVLAFDLRDESIVKAKPEAKQECRCWVKEMYTKGIDAKMITVELKEKEPQIWHVTVKQEESK